MRGLGGDYRAALRHAELAVEQINKRGGVLGGRKATSFFSIKDDLVAAGAKWVDEEVVCEEGLITSRNPDDLPAFNAAITEHFAHQPART